LSWKENAARRSGICRAAFFYDPDGIKLEVVHEPKRAPTTGG
jgi:hypothetical protein